MQQVTNIHYLQEWTKKIEIQTAKTMKSNITKKRPTFWKKYNKRLPLLWFSLSWILQLTLNFVSTNVFKIGFFLWYLTPKILLCTIMEKRLELDWENDENGVFNNCKDAIFQWSNLLKFEKLHLVKRRQYYCFSLHRCTLQFFDNDLANL